MGYNPLSVATYYVALWAPRTDVYSRWTPDGWRPLREPLTPQVALDGLTGKGPSISAYMITPESTSHVMAVDFDTDNGHEQANALARAMKEAGLVPYVEASRRGAHLFAPIDLPLPAKTLRRATRVLLQQALLPTDDTHIEIRPGSDEVAEGGLGHAIRMPLMPHPKTGKAYPLHDADGRPLGKTVAEVLMRVEQGPHQAVTDLAERYTPPPLKHLPKTYRRVMPQDEEDPYENASASEILRELWGVERAQPGKAVRCPAHDDKNPSLSILRDDKRAICKTPGCLLNNDDHGRGTYELTTLAPSGAT